MLKSFWNYRPFFRLQLTFRFIFLFGFFSLVSSPQQTFDFYFRLHSSKFWFFLFILILKNAGMFYLKRQLGNWKQMSDKNSLLDLKIKNSTSFSTTTASPSDGLAHVRLTNIFAPLIDLNSRGDQATDYDSTTLRSLQSTMSSSSSSAPVSYNINNY